MQVSESLSYWRNKRNRPSLQRRYYTSNACVPIVMNSVLHIHNVCTYTYTTLIDRNTPGVLTVLKKLFLCYCRAIINPRHACAARVTVVIMSVCVCLSVCLFVYDYSSTSGYEAAYKRYQQLQCYKSKKNNVAIWLKRLRSRDMA